MTWHHGNLSNTADSQVQHCSCKLHLPISIGAEHEIVLQKHYVLGVTDRYAGIIGEMIDIDKAQIAGKISVFK